MRFEFGAGEFVALVVILGLYFLPAIIATARGLPNAITIFVVNFLSWSVVGWVLALAWAIGRRRV